MIFSARSAQAVAVSGYLIGHATLLVMAVSGENPRNHELVVVRAGDPVVHFTCQRSAETQSCVPLM